MSEQSMIKRTDSLKKQIFLEQFDMSDKKLLARTKNTNLRSLLPPIQTPQPKRTVMGEDQISVLLQNKKLKGKQTKKQIKQSALKHKSIPKVIQFSVKNILQNDKKMNPTLYKRYQKIAQILSFLYNEFPRQNGKFQKQSKGRKKVYHDWELLQISQNYQDTHLGDFVIKIVNPDYLPKEYSKQINKNSGKVTLLQALQIYDHLFNTEKLTDRIIDDYEKQAFNLAFYLLNLNTKIRATKQVEQFMRDFSYLTYISSLNFSQYSDLLKKAEFKQKEMNVDFKIREYKKKLDSIYVKAQCKREQIEQMFTQFKTLIYNLLRDRLVVGFKNQLTSMKLLIKQNEFIRCLLSNIKSISQLFRYFPQLTNHLFTKIRQQIDSGQIKRKLAQGGYLAKISHQGQLRWEMKLKRPNDVLTLMRKFMIYRLTRRGGLFIRSFISKQQTHLFLVAKASQQHLQKKAQQSNFNMQVELGSVDIFSFEPVDRYGRPLRCNKFIRDPSFIKKYNLVSNKQDRDSDLGEKSVESQALNIYTKAIKMNKDELRAKIILDQQQCDECFAWLSNKTGATYIQPDQILNNKENGKQIEDDIWPAYYIYNKMIIQYISKLKLQLTMEKDNKINFRNINNSIGLFLRLMFLKSLNVCNNIYLKHRKKKFRRVRNLFFRKHPLQTIWNQMGEDAPRGYFPYFYSQQLQKIWRKFQINQEKQRSKFSPASRLIITNEIIRQYINISKSIGEGQITDFYPIHDPFILKNIKVRPYLNVISSLIENNGQILIKPQEVKNNFNDTFVQYQCKYTTQDFTKESLQQKLKLKWLSMTDFSVNSVAFYCGQKLALFFQFRRYLTEKAWPLSIITFVIQIIFWVQTTSIQTYGQSGLTNLNNVLMIIMVIVNTFWAEMAVNGWVQHQYKMARSFGTHDIQKTHKNLKRILFEGQMQRNLQDDELNDQKAHTLITVVKQTITFAINIIFVTLLAGVILIIFVMKSQLIQSGYAQSTVTFLPAFLISITNQIFTFAYSKMIKTLVEYENKKTIPQYETSLTFKSFIVSFIVNYFAVFIYAFFSQYFDGQTVCEIITDSGLLINNCYYYISNQVVISIIIDLILTIIIAAYPYIKFILTRYYNERYHNNSNISFNLNYFESIDGFYQEQDRMQTYMYTDQIDRTWEGYTQIVITFTTLVLFAPFVPFLYMMMFAIGVISLIAKKYQIIYYSKRTLPIKVNSIGIWVRVIKFIGVLGVFINIGLVIYVRKAITQNQSIVFFSLVFIILIIKYLLSFRKSLEDEVGNRCKSKTQSLISQKGLLNFQTRNSMINTDIQNIYYDEKLLKRKLPSLRGANVKYK